MSAFFILFWEKSTVILQCIPLLRTQLRTNVVSMKISHNSRMTVLYYIIPTLNQIVSKQALQNLEEQAINQHLPHRENDDESHYLNLHKALYHWQYE